MNIVLKKRGRPPKDQASRGQARDALVAAAVAIVDEGGAGALTARSVAERAGTSVGSVYTLFETLDALRLETTALTIRRLGAWLGGALERCRPGSTEARLLCLAEAYLTFARENHNAWAAMFAPVSVETPEPILADISSLFATVESVLRDGGALPDAEVPVMARALWSSVHGIAFLAETGSLGPILPEDVEPMVAALVRAAVRGFGR